MGASMETRQPEKKTEMRSAARSGVWRHLRGREGLAHGQEEGGSALYASHGHGHDAALLGHGGGTQALPTTWGAWYATF